MPRFAGAEPDELLLEAGNELVGADGHGDIVAGAAGEWRAVDSSDEIDDDAIALLDLGALALRRIRLVLLGDLLQRRRRSRVSATSATSRSSLMLPKSASSIAGSISNDSV